MKFIEMTKHNFEEHKSELIEMSDSFLKELEIQKDRSASDKEQILRNMIKDNSPTHVVIALDDHDVPAGMTYFNEGTGYSCGGDYLWMNCVYVKPAFQKKGFGTAILKHVENWARERNYALFASSRDVTNTRSQALFRGVGFTQKENISIEKVIGNGGRKTSHNSR